MLKPEDFKSFVFKTTNSSAVKNLRLLLIKKVGTSGTVTWSSQSFLMALFTIFRKRSICFIYGILTARFLLAFGYMVFHKTFKVDQKFTV
jgi:hypothetical protein